MSSLAIRLALAITILGGILRLFRYNFLSLWFDEGISIYLARLAWPEIFFNIQHYDTHPFGYPVVLKLVTYVLPEVVAGRLLSVVCGTLTILVLYLLGRRIMNERAALVAALVLAISPLHIWYSQENRPYAGVAFLVAISYLALITFHQQPSWRPAVIYGVSTLFALYYDYSALYALLPQVVIIAYTFWVNRRRALPLLTTGIIALLFFMPGAITMVTTVDAMTQEREAGLGANAERIGVSLSVTGVLGHDRYFLGSLQTLWEKGIPLQWLAGIAVLLFIAYAIILLARRIPAHPLALPVIGGLAFGTLLVGTVSSQYETGFAERTVLTASLGWALLIGATTLAIPHVFMKPRRWPVLGALAGGWSLVVILVYAAFTLYAMYAGSDKDHWREMAIDSESLATWGYPLITYHPVIPVLLDVYEPHLLDANSIAYPATDAVALLKDRPTLPPAVWIDSIELSGVEVLRSGLEGLGYTRILHNYYGQQSLNAMFMDLYAQTAFTPTLIHNVWPPDLDPVTQGWDLPDNATRRPTEDGGGFIFTNNQETEMRTVQAVPAQEHTMYRFTFHARSQLKSGRLRAFFICRASEDKWLAIAPDAGGATEPNDSAWHSVTMSTLCPAGTTSLLLDVRNAGVGTVEFKDFTLDSVSPTP